MDKGVAFCYNRSLLRTDALMTPNIIKYDPVKGRNLPKAPGYYVAMWSLGPQLIYIVDDGEGGLRNTNGATTHFSRWDVNWSDRIEFEPRIY